MSRLKHSGRQMILFRLGLIVIAMLAAMIFIKPQQPKQQLAPPPVNNQAIRYEILNDINQAPERRMLEVLLSHRVTEKELQVLSHQILKGYPQQEYKDFSISFLIPEMSKNHGYWARAEFKQGAPEKFDIQGTTIPELKAFQQASVPEGGQLLGDWLIEETAHASRRAVIRKDQGKYYYQLQWSPDAEFKSVELKPREGETRFTALDKSDDTIYQILDNGDLELSNPDGVIAIGHPLKSYDIPGQ